MFKHLIHLNVFELITPLAKLPQITPTMSGPDALEKS